MKEDSIRPEQLGREGDLLHLEDARKILEHKAEFVRVNCPACDAGETDFLYEKSGFSFVSCRNCGTVYINPRPAFPLLADFYNQAKSLKHWNDKVFPASEEVRRREIFKPRAEKVVEQCFKHGTQKKILLDVGAGFGTFCEEIKKLNFFEKVIAVEPSPDLAATCRRKGLEVIEKPIEEVELKDVNVITNFELIEHLFAPVDFIKACVDALSKNGLFIVTTPNLKGFESATLGRESVSVGGPNHLNYFNLFSLKLLLERCGLTVVETLTPGKLDAELVRKKILNGEFDVSDFPFLRQVLIDKWETVGQNFQDFLADNNLSSHMWLVAKKL